MVFHFRRFSFSFVKDFIAPRSNTSRSTFQTAPSNFDTKQRADPNLQVNQNLRVFSLAELKTATKDFKDCNKIGKGGFAVVYEGMVEDLENPSNRIHVAVKKIKQVPHGYRTWVTEVNHLGEINHRNLVKLIGFCDEENQLFLVYEYMPKRSLEGHLSGKSKAVLPWERRLNIAKDAAIGLEYLHTGMTREIIFRDFKPSNILLDDNWNAKLSDFGFVRNGPEDGKTHVSTMVVGTKGYAAPEYVQTGRLTSKVDVWSYGIFLEELITGQPPKPQNNRENNPQCFGFACCYAGAEESRLTIDSRLDVKYSDKSVQNVMSIAKSCLAKDPKERPTMSEVVKMVKEALEMENQRVGRIFVI